MNLLLVGDDEVDADGRLVLSDRRADHIRRVLAARRGETLRVGMIRGPTGSAEVVASDDARVELAVTWHGADTIAAPPAVDLILAVPRPKVLARVVQTAASMGVRRIDLVNAWRVDKSHLGSGKLADRALRDNLLLGCEQGGSTWVPDIAVHRLLMPFLRQILPRRLSAERPCAIIAHPRATRDLEQAVPGGSSGGVVAAIGPERGWIDRELESFAELGFSSVRLGLRVLRVETAVSALLAQLALLRRL